MSEFPEKDAIISGIGISRIGRRTGVPGLDLTADASKIAIADAGLTAADIDGIASLGETPLDEAAQALGIGEGYRGGRGTGWGGLHAPVLSAFNAVASGEARHILVYRTVKMQGGSMLGAGGQPRQAPPANAPPPPKNNPMAGMAPLIAAHAYAATNWLSMHCQRHMHLYGTTKEQLGWLAVNSRKNAGLNPRAAYREAITLDDYMNARPISTPFGLLDCDVPIDGSVALVISHKDYAKDCANTPLHVEAVGGSAGEGGWMMRPDYPKMASVDAAADMWARTDLKASDLDTAQLYDGFTFLTFAWLEALGICGEGEAGPYVEGATRIALNGELPLNTYGGQLSAGRMHGYWVLHEACLQLRGEAGERQIKKQPEVGIATNGGGPIAGCVLLRR